MGDKIIPVPEKVLYVCTGSKCKKRGGKQIAKSYKAFLKKQKVKGRIQVIKTDCTDRCKFGPVVCLQPQNEWHLYVDEEKAEKLIVEALAK